ncbi:somatoliberin [Mus caroli]|uniref:Somatoliberin n=1 Tax=Mus caroli TaxID=10089 RepID=A0A6P5PDE7_MUSCR|nr:somatoliberin [Mus caroli]XP_021012510.1 somatoliberin [Mus caroli]
MLLWVLFLILILTSGSHCSLPPAPPFRMQRHVDAIFTTNYRKLLSQLYARKVIQDIMNKQGERIQEQRARLSRQEDSMWTEDKQMTLESILQGFPRMKPSADA